MESRVFDGVITMKAVTPFFRAVNSRKAEFLPAQNGNAAPTRSD
jgi:hypothetical protein